jgi:hypothetical protein
MNTAVWIAALALAAAPADGQQHTAKKAPSAKTLATAQMILEQRLPAGIRGGAAQGVGGGPQDPTSRNAAQLVGLIQDTIAPNSWDVRGGEGVIMFYAPGNGVVVRQTGAAHQGVGNVLQQMRRP